MVVNLYLDARATTGEAPVKASISDKNRRVLIPMGVKVHPSQWDAENRVVKNHPNKKELNSFLADRKSDIEVELLRLERLGKLKGASMASIKRMVLRFLNGEEESVRFVERFKHYLSLKTAKKTVKGYRWTLATLEEFDPALDQRTFDEIGVDPQGDAVGGGDGGPGAFVVVGGWDGAVVGSTVMDKWWHWGTGYKPTDEDDNTLSFRVEKADPETGATFGTIVNTPGANGLYANYMYNNETDMNGQYRLIPVGKGRWGKSGSGRIDIYAFEDTEYTTPLHQIEIREAGEYPINDTRILTVSDLAFVRSFPGPFNNNVGDWNNDARWFVDNLRYVIWLVKKDGDAPLPNHADLLAE